MELLASCNKPCATHADAAVSALRHATQIGATGEQEAAERHRGYIALSASPHFDTASAQYKDQRTRCGGATDDDRPASSLQPPRRRTHVCVNWKPTGFPSSRIWWEDVRVLAAILNFEFVRGQKEAPRSCWQWLEFGEIVDGWTRGRKGREARVGFRSLDALLGLEAVPWRRIFDTAYKRNVTDLVVLGTWFDLPQYSSAAMSPRFSSKSTSTGPLIVLTWILGYPFLEKPSLKAKLTPNGEGSDITEADSDLIRGRA
ncbi:hypothetical protein B0H16DRAFT_1461880 [Mycena metata]|uniref:Uncharacterized protein n=1 Tax=Mycena metata TaxID=1033252 RepID=A0AAD7N6T0_9AGAR|nr:hypothetical protein B0H16DRAFT_1461880 [Mycena metata]